MNGYMNRSQISHCSDGRTRDFQAFDSVTKVIDYYQGNPHLCLTKVQEYIDNHPEIYQTDRRALQLFERKFLAGLNAPKSEADQAVQQIKEMQQQRALQFKKPEYDLRPCLRATNRVPQKYAANAQISVTKPPPQEAYDLHIKLGGIVKRRLSSRGRQHPAAAAPAHVKPLNSAQPALQSAIPACDISSKGGAAQQTTQNDFNDYQSPKTQQEKTQTQVREASQPPQPPQLPQLPQLPQTSNVDNDFDDDFDAQEPKSQEIEQTKVAVNNFEINFDLDSAKNTPADLAIELDDSVHDGTTTKQLQPANDDFDDDFD